MQDNSGKVVEKVERKRMPGGKIVERIKEETEGGILHWKRETENAHELEWFRQQIREAYGGRAPRVLDPFAGGGSIPLEAMRLGCDATAVDINPVAWFILKCTLEYPQKLAGKTLPLPDFIVNDLEFMEEFFAKGKGYSKNQTIMALEKLGKPLNDSHQMVMDSSGNTEVDIEADFAWHVRAWGKWVLNRARRELARFYPTYADFEPLDLKNPLPYDKQSIRLVPLKDDGTQDIDALNAEFTEDYLKDRRNPRWVAKPTVAYLWARTVTCKNCRTTVPLLKTRWLCKKDNKRVLLNITSNAEMSDVVFEIDKNVPIKGASAAERREYDRRIGAGTISRSGARCPCCGLVSMTMEDIRAESMAERSSLRLMAVITEGFRTKEYRLPSAYEVCSIEEASAISVEYLSRLKNHSLRSKFNPASTRSISAQLYGVREWKDLFTSRQSLSLSFFGVSVHEATEVLSFKKYPFPWDDALVDYLLWCTLF